MKFLKQNIKISENTVVQEMGDGIVILNLNTERFFEVNEVGKRFWELLTEHQEYTTALHVIQDEYDVSVEQLQEDMNRLMEDLVKAELILLS